jgi:hypothetical protein
MRIQSIVVPAAVVAAAVVSWLQMGWQGLALVSGALVMWGMLHITRLLTIFKRTANRPVGYVDSAVMLNAKLRKGVPLIHVLALTRSLGVLQGEKTGQSEVFLWTDAGGSHVTCTFTAGRLMAWELWRPPVEAGGADAGVAAGGGEGAAP